MFFVPFFKRPLWLILTVCLGCSAQSSSPELNKRIERQVRGYFNVPAAVQVTVGAAKPSEFPNYETVPITFENHGQKTTHDFLVSKDGKTLLRMARIDISPEAYEASLKQDAQKRQQDADLMKKIDMAGRPFRGAKDAKVTMVVYDDFECPYCAAMYKTLFSDPIKAYQDRVRIVFKDFPLFQIHPWARHAAIDANCLAEQSNDAYWDFADYVHANQQEITGKRELPASEAKLDALALDSGKRHNANSEILQSCLKSQPDQALNASVKEADGLGVQATPTLFINGQRLEGALDAPELARLLDSALRDAGAPASAVASSSPTATASATAANK
jgi:protein-disulfide isomerase